jgi:hypothetical protein
MLPATTYVNEDTVVHPRRPYEASMSTEGSSPVRLREGVGLPHNETYLDLNFPEGAPGNPLPELAWKIPRMPRLER